MDKFYDVNAKDLDMVRKKLRIALDFDKLTPRPEIPQKLGTQLEYPNTFT